MSSEFTNIINALSKFLEPKFVKKLEYSGEEETIKIESIDDIKNLPLEIFNFIDKDEANYLEEFLEISNIVEASKFKNIKTREKFDEKIKALYKKYPQFEKKLEKAITISSIISSIKDDTISGDTTQQKVVVIGLDNAGKTAIITKFGGKLGIDDLVGLKPTKGVKRKLIEGSGLDLFVWDLGGQKEYRNKYLKYPEQYFLQIDLLLYVIDVQDSERFAASFEYFEKILEILGNLEENPYLLIFLHKYDPDLKGEPTIELNVEFLKDNLKELFERIELKLDYEIYLTSIYSLISNEPKFSKYIKDVMKSNYSVSDPTITRIDGLGEIVEGLMNAIIKLSESISSQLSAIEQRIEAIEGREYLEVPSEIPSEIPSEVPPEVPSEVPPEEPIHLEESNIEPPKPNSRSSILGELKDLFKKKQKLDL